jgi:hypothetical protein
MQFVVPQFIEVEAKIIGPISARQFVIILVSLGLSFGWFQLFTSPIAFIPLIFLTCAIGGVLAFAKVNGQSMHYFLLNLIQTLKRPRLKVWERMKFQEKVKAVVSAAPPVIPKVQMTESRLAEVSLMVDTGGVYATEERPADVAVTAMPAQPGAPGQPPAANLPPAPGQKINLGG